MTARRMCELGQISRAGFYQFEPDRESLDRDLDLRDEIQRIALEFPFYGRPADHPGTEAARMGWPWIFVLLAVIARSILTVVLFLPEPHTLDHAMSLHPVLLLRTYRDLWKQPQICTYAIARAFSFSGLFSYVAGSPIIFTDGFHVSAQAFGVIFATLTGGFIAGSKLNILLLRRFASSRIFSTGLTIQSRVSCSS